MGRFLESEKKRLSIFTTTSNYFSEEAREDGEYKGKPRPFCLPRSYSDENVYSGIREEVIEYFTNYEIKWHDAIDKKPSNHLCDSMVCSINFLFPFAYEPFALKELLFPLFPNIKQVLPMEKEDQYLSMEWIGKENYLGEKMPRHGKRTRGANFTSTDAAVMFERTDGQKQIVLIEWKYTETYYSTYLKYAKSGTDRTKIYSHLFNEDNKIIDKDLLPSFDSLFFEPFYQFMRQQYLAKKMEEARELGADIVSLLHIAPSHNMDFRRITSPDLQHLGGSATDVWDIIVKKPGRFISVSTENLFETFEISHFPELKDWLRYITSRYPWVNE